MSEKNRDEEAWYRLIMKAANRIYWEDNKERIVKELKERQESRAKEGPTCHESKASCPDPSYCLCCHKPIEDGDGVVKRGSLFCSRCCATDYHEAMLEDKADARKEQER